MPRKKISPAQASYVTRRVVFLLQKNKPKNKGGKNLRASSETVQSSSYSASSSSLSKIKNFTIEIAAFLTKASKVLQGELSKVKNNILVAVTQKKPRVSLKKNKTKKKAVKPVLVFDASSKIRIILEKTDLVLEKSRLLITSSLASIFTKLKVVQKKLKKLWIVQLFYYILYSLVKAPRVYPKSLGFLLLCILLLFFGTRFLFTFVFENLPDPLLLEQKAPLQTSKILDKNGSVLYRVFEEENRTLVNLESIPPHVLLATIAIEDKDFYQHQGFSLKGIIRATVANFSGETVQGGSTLTQQLVKNRLLSSEKTFQRKARELILALMVEQKYDKEQILEMYLNTVAYGGSTYGIEAAAQRYFGKPAAQLNLAEGTFLAGLPQAPSAYTPFGPTPERGKKRQEEVLRRMVEDGYITIETAQAAATQPLQFVSDTYNIQAPHFVMYVRALIAEKYGEEMLEQGGLEVTTTLDLALHKEVETLVASEVATLKRLRISNGAALVTNPQTGEILSMVGGANYFDFTNDGQVNVTLRPRQPGSSIKPLTYALAFEAGKNPSTTILDAPTTYNLIGSPPYSPKNYDGKFHGNVTLRESLGSSYNIPAVKLLAEMGVSNLITKGKDFGIDTWNDPTRFGLSLTLGGGEIHMTDMAEAYGVFANKGNRVDLNPILEVKASDGTVLYQNPCVFKTTEPCKKHRAVSEQTAFLITHVLMDNKARTPAFGPHSTLTIPGQEVAVKTGTTNNLRDNWTIGYTTDRVVAVWVGNNDNTPMSYVASGVTGASPIWNNITRLMLSPDNPHVFARPGNMVEVQICATTGTLPCQYCPRVTTELFAADKVPTQACNLKPPAPSKTPTPQASPTPPGQIL